MANSNWTLLSMTQNILSSLNSDQVNSISDTVESTQVANIIQTVYYNICSRANFPEHTQLFQLNSSQDITKPTLMYCPTGLNRMDWVKYYNDDFGGYIEADQYGAYSQHDVNLDLENNANSYSRGLANTSATTSSGTTIQFNTVPTWVEFNQAVVDLTNPSAIPADTFVRSTTQSTVTLSNSVTNVEAGDLISFSPLSSTQFYQEVRMISVREFLDMVNKFNPQDGNISSFNFQNMNIRYKVDKKPQFCTVLQNYYVIFDSYVSILDSTLQTSKTQCYGQLIPPFAMEDSFIPDMDDQTYPLLFNEAKSLAFVELKQTVNSKAEQESKRQWSNLQKNKAVSDKPTYFEQLPSFGRKIGTGGYAVQSRRRI